MLQWNKLLNMFIHKYLNYLSFFDFIIMNIVINRMPRDKNWAFSRVSRIKKLFYSFPHWFISFHSSNYFILPWIRIEMDKIEESI